MRPVSSILVVLALFFGSPAPSDAQIRRMISVSGFGGILIPPDTGPYDQAGFLYGVQGAAEVSPRLVSVWRSSGRTAGIF